MITGPVAAPSLVGRSQHLEHLTQRRLAAARGRGGAVLVCGESGIGKSRLVRAFRETLRGGRARFGIGFCAETGTVPYAPLRAALAAAGCGTPEVAQAQSQQELIAGFVRALEAASAKRNIVLVVEDLHWADQGTLSALVQMVPALSSLRTLLVLTYRDDEFEPAAAAAAAIARLERYAERMPLEPLAPHDMRVLLSSALGERVAEAAVLDRVVGRAEGNPFFAEELLKNALEGHVPGKQQLPLTIRAVVLERLARFDAPVQSIAQHAAILGRTFRVSPLSALTGCSAATVLCALRALRDGQIVDADEHDAELFAFRHSLTRDVIYHRMLPAELAPIHARVLALLETSERSAPAHDLGYHALMAADNERCRRYNEEAGDEADAVHAYGDAVQFYERAIALGAPPATRLRIIGKAAACAAKGGKANDARRLYERAVSDAQACADADAVSELRCAMAAQARLAGDSIGAEGILAQALAQTVPDSGLALKIALNLAFCKCDRADVHAAEALVANCLPARETDAYWAAMRYIASVNGDVAGVRAAAEQSMRLAEGSGLLPQLRARFNLGFTLCALGYDEEARTLFESLLPQLREARFYSLEVLTCANLALILARAGCSTDARALIQNALAVPEPQTTGPVALAAAALTVARALDDEDLVARSVQPHVIETAFRCGIDSTLGRIAGPYARWLDKQGRRAQAQDVLRTALAKLAGPFGATESILAAAQLLPERNEDLKRLLSNLDALRIIPLYCATAAHVRALLAGNGADARFYALDAAATYDAMKWPLHAGECRAIGADVAAVPEQPVIDAPGLSLREAQIAALAAAGTSNRALAERLSVSQRTIEKHLTAIYTKLGLRNRSQLAALMAAGAQRQDGEGAIRATRTD